MIFNEAQSWKATWLHCVIYMIMYMICRYYLGVLNGSLWSSAVVLGRRWPRLALKTIQFRRRIAGIEALRVGRGAQQLCAGGRGAQPLRLKLLSVHAQVRRVYTT